MSRVHIKYWYQHVDVGIYENTPRTGNLFIRGVCLLKGDALSVLTAVISARVCDSIHGDVSFNVAWIERGHLNAR